LLACVHGILEKKNTKLETINSRWISHLFSDERLENAKELLKFVLNIPIDF
jgi:hypothetical protein